MGEIVVEIELENDRDRGRFEDGHIEESEIRQIRVNAVADTGAIMLALPQDVVGDLGLPLVGTVDSTLADGSRVELPVAGSLNLGFASHQMQTDAIVVPAGAETLIGQLVMERLDLIADCRNRTLSPRPVSPNGPLLRL